MKFVVIVFFLIIVLILAVYAYYGGFSRVIKKVEVTGGETLVYEKLTGDYKNSGKVSDRVYYSLLKDFNIETFKGVGIYYDKPGTVESSKLRSDIGCFIEDKDLYRVEELKDKFEIKKIDIKKYLIVELPYRGLLSVFIGMMKAYPALEKASVEMDIPLNTPVTEICDVPNNKLIYRKVIE